MTDDLMEIALKNRNRWLDHLRVISDPDCGAWTISNHQVVASIMEWVKQLPESSET